jgi:transcriptional regulator
MRHNPRYAVTDAAVVRTLIAENPWATIVSSTDAGMVASHYPVLLDDRDDELAVFTHVGRPDDEIHRLPDGEVMLIVAGPHGYVSPSWYSGDRKRAPTWNFSVAHCYGVPQLLDGEENLRVLTRLVDHFEQHVAEPARLDQQFGARLATGTVGVRLPISRFVCKVKMSQNEDEQTQRRILQELRGTGRYGNPRLADDMERALSRRTA